MTRKSTGLVPHRVGPAPAKSAPLVSSLRMVSTVFAELPPTLPAGMEAQTYLAQTHEFIGAHPDPVLISAREALLSTCVFAPKKSEIIQAILNAYLRLGIPLSPDAQKHAEYRRKLPARYAISPAGLKRFADDARVVTVGYVAVLGPQVNLILDDIGGATVEDVEKAIAGVHRAFAGADRVSGDDVLERLRTEVGIQVAYRLNGDPADLCGGPVAEVGARGRMFRCWSTWLALSESFVNRMRDQYPHARSQADHVHWGEAMKEAFQGVAHKVDTSRYGDGLQAEAEAAIAARMAELNRTGRVEIMTARRFQARQIGTVMATIATAETRLISGHECGEIVTIGDERLALRSLEDCGIARNKAETARDRIETEIKALGELK